MRSRRPAGASSASAVIMRTPVSSARSSMSNLGDGAATTRPAAVAADRVETRRHAFGEEREVFGAHQLRRFDHALRAEFALRPARGRSAFARRRSTSPGSARCNRSGRSRPSSRRRRAGRARCVPPSRAHAGVERAHGAEQRRARRESRCASCPAWTAPIVTTAGSSGSIWRATICCTATMNAPAT